MPTISRRQQKMHEVAHAVARVILASYFAAKALGLILNTPSSGIGVDT